MRNLYEKQEWEDKPSKKTPIRAEGLLHMENGIRKNSEDMALREIYGDENLLLSGDSRISAHSASNIVAGSGNLVSYGNSSIVTGQQNTLDGGADNVVAGQGNVVSGTENIVSGKGNRAAGQYLAVFGTGHTVSTGAAAVFGIGNKTSSGYQMVEGKYNVEDTGNTYAHIAGGGTSDADRRNIYTLDWEGNAHFAGEIENGSGVTMGSLKSAVDALNGAAAGIRAMTYEETMAVLNGGGSA